MNAEPHTHRVVIRQQWEFNHTGSWYVEYGDTKVWAGFGWWVSLLNEERQRRLFARATRKAIRKHDRGTREAAYQEETAQVRTAAMVDFNQRLLQTDWGSNQLEVIK
jgi:hypothetical protein